MVSAKSSLPRRSTGHGFHGRRYFYLIVGYYLFSVYIRASSARSDTLSTDDGALNHERKPLENIPESHDTIVHDGHGEHVHGIQIAKVDFETVETPFIIALWIFCASLAKIGFHMAPKLSHIFPESCLLIVVGVIIGLLLFHTNSVHVSPLTPKTFFFYMLPPIILDAGYFMPNRLFFNNLGTILLFAVIGTLWNTFTIGLSLWGLGLTNLFGIDLPLLQTLLFSALVSAVDPVAVLAVFEEIHVNEILYIVVFGESLLNDAVTVVLYHMFEEYATMGADKVTVVEVVKGITSFPVVALGGTLIGIIWGFLTGFVTRFTNNVRVIEPIFIFVMAYLSYLCAETFHMSGILAITFCGITMKNYVEANISHKSHTTVKYAMKMLSSSSETIIFMFLGVSTIHDDHNWNIWFIVATITFCSIYRIFGVIILSYFANRCRLHKLGRVDQFVMSYGGLRGAVAFALVLLIEEKAVNGNKELLKMFVSTTITVVYFTVFVQGITIKPLVQWLKVKRAEKRKITMNERIHERLMDHLMSGMEGLLGQYGHYNLRNKFKKFDNSYIRPCLIRDLKGAEPKIIETYAKLTMKDAMDMMNRNPNVNPSKLSPESMAALLRNVNLTSNRNFATEGSTNNLDSWNFDVQELEYNISRKDMSDAKIHHLLEEELYKPYRRHRRLSYSRHAVHERDLGTEQQVNYKAQVNFKKMVSDKALKQNNIRQRRSGNINKDERFGEEYDNPGFSMDDEKMQRGSNDKSIYFIAGRQGRPSSPSTEGNGLGDYNKDWTERRWSQSSVSSNKSYLEHAYPHNSVPIHKSVARRMSKFSDIYDDVPTLTEMTLPWRRDGLDINGVPNNAVLPNNNASRFRVTPIRRMSRRDDDAPASMTTLPWKRDEGDDESGSLPQHEFPAWSTNKDYMTYASPTNTYLGGLDRGNHRQPVHGLFKRDSVTSIASRKNSIASRLDSPRHSVSSDSNNEDGLGPSVVIGPVVGNPVRRSSQFLTVAIPEGIEETEESPIVNIDEPKIKVPIIIDKPNDLHATTIIEKDESSDSDDEDSENKDEKGQSNGTKIVKIINRDKREDHDDDVRL